MTSATHSQKSRRQVYLLIGVLLSVLVAFGIRYHAGAAETEPRLTATEPSESSTGPSTKREEIDGVVFEMSDDGLVGITVRNQKLRFEQDTKAAPATVDKAQLEALGSEMKTTIKEDYGWDVSSSVDRQGILDEVRRLSGELHTIPDSTLKSEENKALADLRDLIDMVKGVSECRGRCLPPPSGAIFFYIVPFVAIGSAIAAIQASYANPAIPKEFVDSVFTSMAASNTIAAFCFFTALEIVFRINSAPLKNAVMGALFVTLSFISQNSHDARGLAEELSTTPADGAKAEAKDISELTPATADDPADYDMVHDEL